MAAAVGVASSVTTFIGNIVTLISCGNDVYDTRTEISLFLREPKHLRIYVFALDKFFRDEPQTAVAEDLEGVGRQSSRQYFQRGYEVTQVADKKLRVAPPQWKIVKKRLLWTLAETSVRDDHIIPIEVPRLPFSLPHTLNLYILPERQAFPSWQLRDDVDGFYN
ncbi:hypothetical protein EDD18DRAFT_1361101 [Armillaria luteobubalina]|uniref:Uncharacterized protein n=1 Tax=Armillaria luteobubalina TaxID=153913 RepID=A0AA39UFS0_9AGAR|nr:hypothetical protein EDD18DRAFT_1361101 [Armillaria luteobubalina]